MKVIAYCFIKGVIYNPVPKPFEIFGGTARLTLDRSASVPGKPGEGPMYNGSTLTFETDADIAEFMRSEDDATDPAHKKSFEKIGELLDKYRSILSEIAIVVEGLVSLSAIQTMPPFAIGHVNVRLRAETLEEEALIKSEKLSHTFGDVGVERSEMGIKVNAADQMLAPATKASERTSALSIYLTGVRAIERFENELAYASFFRIIEGYLGDGTSNIERSLRAKQAEVNSYLLFDQKGLDALHRILKKLSLPCTAKDTSDGEGIVADLVLLRHKVMHYNLKAQDRHFYGALRADLKLVVQQHMQRAAFFLLREDLGMSKKEAP